MIRFFEQVENVILKRDPSLKSLIPSGQKSHEYFYEFFKIFFNHAKSWRLLAQINFDSRKNCGVKLPHLP